MIKTCNNGGFVVDFGLKLFIYGVFYDFYLIFKVFINVFEYANGMIYISDQTMNDLGLSFNLVPSLVSRISSTLVTIDFVGIPIILRII